MAEETFSQTSAWPRRRRRRRSNRAHVDYNEMSVRYGSVKLQLPTGFKSLLEHLTREILREQPANIPEFAAAYFKHLLQKREDGVPDPAYLINERITETAGAGELQPAVVDEPVVESPTQDEEPTAQPAASEQADEEMPDLNDPEVAKAATLIQASFRGFQVRKSLSPQQSPTHKDVEYLRGLSSASTSSVMAAGTSADAIDSAVLTIDDVATTGTKHDSASSLYVTVSETTPDILESPASPGQRRHSDTAQPAVATASTVPQAPKSSPAVGQAIGNQKAVDIASVSEAGSAVEKDQGVTEAVGQEDVEVPEVVQDTAVADEEKAVDAASNSQLVSPDYNNPEESNLPVVDSKDESVEESVVAASSSKIANVVSDSQQSAHDSSNQEETGLAEANSRDLESEQGVVIVDCGNAEVSEPMQIAAQVAAVEIEVEQPAEAAAAENASAVSQEDYKSKPDLAKQSAEDQTTKSTSQELTAVIVAPDIEDTEQMIAVDQASVEAEHGSVVGDRLPEVEASLMEDQAESHQDIDNQGEAEVDLPAQPVEELNASDLPASADVSGENGNSGSQSEIEDPVPISTEIKDEAVDSTALDDGNASADVDENTVAEPEAVESPVNEVGAARSQQEQELIEDSSPISQNDTESSPDQPDVLEQAQPEDITETEQGQIEVKSSSQSQVETEAEQEESTTEADAPQQSEQPADEAPADVSTEVTETQAAEETQPEPSKEEQPAEPEQVQEPTAQDEAPAEDPTEAPQEPPAQEESEPVAQQEETAEAPQEAAADVETSEPGAQEEAAVEATQEAPTDAEVSNAEEANTEPASESTPDSKEEEQKEEDQKEEAPAAEAPSEEPAAETTEEQKVEEPASEEPAAEAAESPKTEEPEKESAANAEEPESESTAQPAADGEKPEEAAAEETKVEPEVSMAEQES